MRPCFLTVAVLCLCAHVSPQHADAQSNRFVRWAYSDAGALASGIVSDTPRFAFGTAMVLASTSIVDDDLNAHLERQRYGAFGSFLDRANFFGGPGVTLPVAGAFAASLLTNDRRLQDAAFTSLQSLVYAGILSYGIKYSVGRVRPHDVADPFRFEPFSGHSSFPSGHTTTAFAVVTPWVLYYPGPATYALMAIPAGTALARISRFKHWGTDTVAGAALGVATARFLVRRHRSVATPAPHHGRARLSFTPGGFSLTMAIGTR